MNNLIVREKKKPFKSYDLKGFNSTCISTCGERGIRTPGPVTVNSFQDCRIRPLCHFSSNSLPLLIASANISCFFGFFILFEQKNELIFNLFFNQFIFLVLANRKIELIIKIVLSSLRILLFLDRNLSFLRVFLAQNYSPI